MRILFKIDQNGEIEFVQLNPTQLKQGYDDDDYEEEEIETNNEL